jgi:hypothetical protein
MMIELVGGYAWITELGAGALALPPPTLVEEVVCAEVLPAGVVAPAVVRVL